MSMVGTREELLSSPAPPCKLTGHSVSKISLAGAVRGSVQLCREGGQGTRLEHLPHRRPDLGPGR